MNTFILLVLAFYIFINFITIIIVIFKIKERIKEKPQDDIELKKFKKY